MPRLVWLVTGATSGLGAALVAHLVDRGEQVIAAGRGVDEKLAHLRSDNVRVLELDITVSFEEVKSKMKQAWDLFGHVDVLMNNAGVSAMKPFEEADDDFIDFTFQANVFGHMHVTRAILPFLREQGSGTIAFTSSSSVWLTLPFLTHYNMSKAAISVLADSLHKEVSDLGIQCVAFDCGAFPTRLGHPRPSATSLAAQQGFTDAMPRIEAYQPFFGRYMAMFTQEVGSVMIGDPTKAAQAIADVVKREGVAAGRSWASRVVLGSDAAITQHVKREDQLTVIRKWEDLSKSTDKSDYVLKDEFRYFMATPGAEE